METKDMAAVPAARDMQIRTFWKHLDLRHQHLANYSLYEHDLDHDENPGLDHIHLRNGKL